MFKKYNVVISKQLMKTLFIHFNLGSNNAGLKSLNSKKNKLLSNGYDKTEESIVELVRAIA